MFSPHEPEQLVGPQDRLVARAAPLYEQEEVMTNVKAHFVWIDVSKDRFTQVQNFAWLVGGIADLIYS